jgi:hypothetical protein
MGKTTNNLLEAADTALVSGTVDLSAVRELHTASAAELGVTEDTSYAEVLRPWHTLETHALPPSRVQLLLILRVALGTA